MRRNKSRQQLSKERREYREIWKLKNGFRPRGKRKVITFGEIWDMFIEENSKEYINNIKESLYKLRKYISLEKKKFTYKDIIKKHKPKGVEDYKYISELIQRELSYWQTHAHFNEMRNSKNAFYYTHWQLNKVVEPDWLYDTNDLI